MAKKPIRDDSTFLGFTKINGVRVPFWEDNKPTDLEERVGMEDSPDRSLNHRFS